LNRLEKRELIAPEKITTAIENINPLLSIF